MLFAATVGEDDIKLFKYHVKEDNKWKGRIVEIKVDASINSTGRTPIWRTAATPVIGRPTRR